MVPAAEEVAGGADAQALQVVSGRLLLDAAKDAGKMNGMDSGVARQVAHSQIFAELVLEAVFDA